MKSAPMRGVLSVLKTAVSVYLTVIVSVTLFNALLRIVGVLAPDRFRGDPSISAIKRHLSTLWGDALDARLIANLVAPVVVVVLVLLPPRMRVLRAFAWSIAFAITYEVLADGGWGGMLARKGGIWYLVLLLQGLFCAFLQPLLDVALWHTLGKLRDTRVFGTAS